MAFTTRQAASEDRSAQEAAAKPSVQLFNDERSSTATQLKQQQMMTSSQSAPLQRAEDEELLQGKFATAQLMEEEEPLQGKFVAQRVEEEEPLQGKFATAQLMEEEEPLQGKFEPLQRAAEEEEPLQGKFSSDATAQREQKPNHTGMPDNLKSGIENLSGYAMDDVKVHYNSAKPAQLNAHAYAQGTDIHVAPGQEQHLPHEAWHVVQQKQGRVQPTMQMKAGVPVNDDAGLENEADVMGAKAVALTNNIVQKKSEMNINGSVRQYVKDDPVVSVALDTDKKSVKRDVNRAMAKLKETILNNQELLEQLNKHGRDRKIYAPIQSLWKKMDGLLRSWNNSWSVEDTCGLMLDIGLQLGRGIRSAPQFEMTDEMKESRRDEGVQGSNWEQEFLPEGTRTKSGVSATTIRLLKTLSIDNRITALEIEAVMNGVCMYWDHSLIKKLTGEYHTTAEVWSTYNNFLLNAE